MGRLATAGWLAASNLIAAATASSQTCAPEWLDTFGGLSGTDGAIHAAAVANLGSGAELFTAGEFRVAGNERVFGAARFDGTAWRPAGGGFSESSVVRDMLAFDDGSGLEVYAAGTLQLEGGALTAPIARFDGAVWNLLPGFALTQTRIDSLVLFDDGTGVSLYALGEVTLTGGAPAVGLSRWTGSGWVDALDGIIEASPGTIAGLAVYDDGGGDALYVSGARYRYVDAAASTVIDGVSRLEGRRLLPLGTWPGYQTGDRVTSLAVHDAGGGPELYAAGVAPGAAPQGSSRAVARWNGVAWTSVGAGLGNDVAIHDLAIYDNGTGSTLYATGSFRGSLTGSHRGIARFNGASWDPLGSGLQGGSMPTGRTLEVADLGLGPRLFVGGHFEVAGGMAATNAAQFDGTAWSAASPTSTTRLNGFAHDVCALVSFNEGSREMLFAGGSFTSAGLARAPGVARWNGTSWSSVGNGVTSVDLDQNVKAMTVKADGAGNSLFVGGRFDRAGNVSCSNLAQWDGTDWQDVGGGVNTLVPHPSLDPVQDMVVFDEGSGPVLFIAGVFANAGGVSAPGVARWDGGQFSGLAGGAPINGFGEVSAVFDLAVYDDGLGGGPALYAGGLFADLGGTPGTRGLARWNGTAWEPVGTGLASGEVRSLGVTRLGTSEILLVGGDFTLQIGGTPEILAAWDGALLVGASASLSGASGLSSVDAIATFDDGTAAGARTFVAGSPPASSTAQRSVAGWIGSDWEFIAGGPVGRVGVLLPFDDRQGLGPTLFAGGSFAFTQAQTSSRLARYGACTVGAVGERYCASSPNSTGSVGELAAFGSTVAAQNLLTLSAAGLPPSVFGIFITSQTEGLSAAPLSSQGFICIGGLVGRFIEPGQVLATGPNGGFRLRLDLTRMPQGGLTVGASGGETWHFQAWYRDSNPAPTSNFTTGLRVLLR